MLYWEPIKDATASLREQMCHTQAYCLFKQALACGVTEDMYAYECIHTYVCIMHTYVYIRMYAYVCIQKIYMHTYVYIRMYAYVCIQKICMYTYVYIRMYAYVC
jgi:hypothetical protein